MARGGGRWYRHGWNTTCSLRLMLAIVPRLPRRLVPPVAALTTAVCLASMRWERRATARNLRRILGRGGPALWGAQWRLFYNYSRFMVGYCDLRGVTLAQLLERTEAAPATEARLREALAEGRGAVVLTAHLGNWELGARMLELVDRPIHIVMHAEWTHPVERWLLRLRRTSQVRVIRIGRSFQGTLDVAAALGRNEVVAMQGDRAPSGRTIDVELFGAPFPLPIGPFLTAYHCAAPIVPAFVIQRGWSEWRAETTAPIRFPRTGERDADLQAGAEAYARELERMVRSHPDQWFNFYDMWEPTPAERRP